MFFFSLCRNPGPRTHPIDPRSIVRSLAPAGPPDASGFIEDGAGAGSLLVQGVHWNTARSRLEGAPFVHGPSGFRAVSWARLDNRDEIGEMLALDRAALAGRSDTELILKSYLAWQEGCMERLIGDFAFVIHDPVAGMVFCGRDHMGVRPLYYYHSPDLFVCASSLGALVGLESVPVRIDPRWVAEYLTGLSMSFDRTPYERIRKLPPGHCLTVSPEGTRLRQYSDLSSVPPLILKDSREYVDLYRETLKAAVACRLDSDYPIGAELSGGLDSSTITALAAKVPDRSLSGLHTFAFVSSEMEPRYIGAVVEECGIVHHHAFTAGEIESDTLSRSLALLGYPVEHGNAISYEPFYRLAEDLGVRTLLSGFGGDEFVTTITGYLIRLDLLVRRRFRDLLHILPGNLLFRFLNLMRLEGKRLVTRNFTVPALNPAMAKAMQARWHHRIVRDDLVKEWDLEARYLHRARLDAGYTDLKRFTLEQGWQPYVPTRMENCSLMAAGRKIEYRWPLLDIRLVRLFLAIPSEEQYFRGMGRYLHRRAVKGIVPDRITWKRSKNMGALLKRDALDGRRRSGLAVGDLHPGMREYVDEERLARQIALLSSPGKPGPDNPVRHQIARNVRMAENLSAWLKYIETCPGLY